MSSYRPVGDPRYMATPPGFVSGDQAPQAIPFPRAPSTAISRHAPSAAYRVQTVAPSMHASSRAPSMHAPSRAPSVHVQSRAPSMYAPSRAPSMRAPSIAADDIVNRYPSLREPSEHDSISQVGSRHNAYPPPMSVHSSHAGRRHSRRPSVFHAGLIPPASSHVRSSYTERPPASYVPSHAPTVRGSAYEHTPSHASRALIGPSVEILPDDYASTVRPSRRASNAGHPSSEASRPHHDLVRRSSSRVPASSYAESSRSSRCRDPFGNDGRDDPFSDNYRHGDARMSRLNRALEDMRINRSGSASLDVVQGVNITTRSGTSITAVTAISARGLDRSMPPPSFARRAPHSDPFADSREEYHW